MAVRSRSIMLLVKVTYPTEIPPVVIQFGMRHLVNAYEVEAGTVKFAGNTV